MILERHQVAPGFVQQFQTQCPKCKGKGKMINKHCHVCSGKRIVKGVEELTIFVERGMTNGQEIVRIINLYYRNLKNLERKESISHLDT